MGIRLGIGYQGGHLLCICILNCLSPPAHLQRPASNCKPSWSSSSSSLSRIFGSLDRHRRIALFSVCLLNSRWQVEKFAFDIDHMCAQRKNIRWKVENIPNYSQYHLQASYYKHTFMAVNILLNLCNFSVCKYAASSGSSESPCLRVLHPVAVEPYFLFSWRFSPFPAHNRMKLFAFTEWLNPPDRCACVDSIIP